MVVLLYFIPTLDPFHSRESSERNDSTDILINHYIRSSLNSRVQKCGTVTLHLMMLLGERESSLIKDGRVLVNCVKPWDIQTSMTSSVANQSASSTPVSKVATTPSDKQLLYSSPSSLMRISGLHFFFYKRPVYNGCSNKNWRQFLIG